MRFQYIFVNPEFSQKFIQQRVLCSTPRLVFYCMYKKLFVKIKNEFMGIKYLKILEVDSSALLLIIAVKINFGVGYKNMDYQTNKLQILLIKQTIQV